MEMPEEQKDIIVLSEEINSESALEFVSEILMSAKRNPDKPIVMAINSYGGCYRSGMMIVDTIKALKQKTVIFNLGAAYSAAAMIFLAADVRYAFPSSWFMIHSLHYSGVDGSPNAIKNTAALAERNMLEAETFILKNSGIKPAKLKDVIAKREDWYFNAKEAKKMKVATSISANMLKEIK